MQAGSRDVYRGGIVDRLPPLLPHLDISLKVGKHVLKKQTIRVRRMQSPVSISKHAKHLRSAVVKLMNLFLHASQQYCRHVLYIVSLFVVSLLGCYTNSGKDVRISYQRSRYGTVNKSQWGSV